MNLPTPYTVGVRAYIPGLIDAHGNEVSGWADPVEISVYAIAPRTSNEPEPGRMEVYVGKSILAPPSANIGPHDHVVIDGVEYEVEGEVGDWNTGPFSWSPGISINLSRVEG